MMDQWLYGQWSFRHCQSQSDLSPSSTIPHNLVSQADCITDGHLWTHPTLADSVAIFEMTHSTKAAVSLLIPCSLFLAVPSAVSATLTYTLWFSYSQASFSLISSNFKLVGNEIFMERLKIVQKLFNLEQEHIVKHFTLVIISFSFDLCNLRIYSTLHLQFLASILQQFWKLPFSSSMRFLPNPFPTQWLRLLF